MGKSLAGKELGVGITQRKDGLYQGRFTNRFGKKEIVYDKKLSEVRRKLEEAKFSDHRKESVIQKDMTLDEWFEKCISTFKKNCRDTTLRVYRTRYNAVKKDLGWRKLTQLNLVIIQDAINGLDTDQMRKDSKKILCDVLNKALDAQLITKNFALQVNTVITREEKKERRILNQAERKLFLKEIEGHWYKTLFILALETGMRVGELTGLQWEDVDFEKGEINICHNLCFTVIDGKSVRQLHDPKTVSSKRTIPLTSRAVQALQEQKTMKREFTSGKEFPKEFSNYVFVSSVGTPIKRESLQYSLNSVIGAIQKTHPEFEHFTLHCLRHTFATTAIENGVRPKTVQKLLGHSSLAMTMDLYCHVSSDAMDEDMKLLEACV